MLDLDLSVCTYHDLVLACARTYTVPFNPRNIEHDLQEMYPYPAWDWSRCTSGTTGMVLHGEAVKLNGCVKRVARGVYVYVQGTVPSKIRRVYENKSVRTTPMSVRTAHIRLNNQFAKLLTPEMKQTYERGEVESVKCNQCVVRVRVSELGEHKRIHHPLNMDNARNTRTIQRERKYGVQGDTSGTDNK